MRNPAAGFRVAEMHLSARDNAPSMYQTWTTDLNRLTNWFFRINGFTEREANEMIQDWRKWGPPVNEFRRKSPANF